MTSSLQLELGKRSLQICGTEVSTDQTTQRMQTPDPRARAVRQLCALQQANLAV